MKWGELPDNIFYEGPIPEGYDLAISPSNDMIIIDVDIHDNKNGFEFLPMNLIPELEDTLNYSTKNSGRHYWFKYTGIVELANKVSDYGIDLRTNKGYVVWYPKTDIRKYIHLIRKTSNEMNEWLIKLFARKHISRV